MQKSMKVSQQAVPTRSTSKVCYSSSLKSLQRWTVLQEGISSSQNVTTTEDVTVLKTQRGKTFSIVKESSRTALLRTT